MKQFYLVILLTINLFFIANQLFSQKDFNNFITSQSVGTISEDFSSLTYEKIKADLKESKRDLSKSKEKKFLKNIHYGIDDILHSGLVIYGDEISNYVSSVADKLLSDDKSLRSKLRFYTIKSNATNAFSTDQGIIFVTTGLISQLTSEAQLALILAHEISHYTEKHVVESFEVTSNNTNRNIIDLSIYSKDHEIEADKKGLTFYKSAGYSKDEILPTFDVIMYSYLPFEEIEVPITYFNTTNMYIPESLFPTKKYEIKAIEDYDDSESSHPNIKKRKDEISSEIDALKNWGDKSFLFGKQKFEYIRNICRFESVRSDILNSNYGDAIYSIFILEKEFKNSIFLKRMKAQAWLGLAQYKENGSISQTLDKNSELEGEIATIHFFIKKLSKDGLFTLALRQVYDLKKENPNDKHIDAIYNYLVKELVYSKNFKLDKYSSKNFSDAANEFLQNKTNASKKEVETNENEAKPKNKYDKIKTKKNADNIENFDSTRFYFYGISDVIVATNFTDVFKKYSDEFDAEEKKTAEFDRLTSKQQKKQLKKEETEKLYLGLNDVIIVEPMVFSYKKDELNLLKSEKLKHDFSIAIDQAAKDAGLKTYTIDRDHLATKGTEGYNERNILFNFFNQVAQEDDFNIFPVDYELLEEIKNNHSASKVIFSLVEYNHTPKITSYGLFMSIVLYPSLPIYIPHALLSGNQTQFNVIILDLDEAKIEVGTSYESDDTPKKHHLGAHMYNLFEKLKNKKSK